MGKSLASAILSVFIGRATTLAIGLLFTPLLVRLLGPEDYGRYALAISSFVMINVFVSSGTNDAIRKYISERPEQKWRNTTFRYVFKIAVLLGIAGSIVTILLTYLGVVRGIFGMGYDILFYLIALLVLVQNLRVFFMRSLMGLKLESYSEPLRVLRKAVFSIVALVAVYLEYDVIGVLFADILVCILVITIAVFLLSKHLSLNPFESVSVEPIPKSNINTYIITTVIFFAFLTSLYHVDILFVEYWMDSEEVGYYKGALVIAEFLWLAPIAVQLSLLQRMSSHWKNNEYDLIQRKVSRIEKFVILFTSLLAVGIAVLAEEFVPLYFGSDFTPTITPLLLLLPGVVGFSAARPMIAVHQARRSLRPLIYATGASALINITLNTLLIPRYGLIGAAVATSTGYFSLLVSQTVVAHRLNYSPFAGFHVFRYLVTVLCTAGLLTGINYFVDSTLLSLALIPPVGFFTFWTLAIASRAIDRQEVEAICRVFPDSIRLIVKRGLSIIPVVL